MPDPPCPNCGRSRAESFCPHCGQSDRDYARSLGAVIGGFLRETFEVDSRLYRTLKLLLFRPGRLTAEFSRNRRASYMSPVRLYIFASFVFFLVLSLTGRLDTAEATISVPSMELPEGQLPDDEGVEAFKASLPVEYRTKVDDILNRPEGDPARAALLGIAAGDPREMSRFDRFFVLGGLDLLHDPSLIGERVVGNLPIAMFFLLPFYALALQVFHLRKGRFFVEHLVFAIHVQTFIFIVYTVWLLLSDVGPLDWVGLICALLPYPYFLMAFRRYYEDGWPLTVVKAMGVMTLYSVVFVPALMVSVFLTT